jgi:hypothetical protein
VIRDFERRPDCDYGRGDAGLLVNIRSVEQRELHWAPDFSLNRGEESPQIDSLLGSIRDRNGREEILPWRYADNTPFQVADLTRMGDHDFNEAMKHNRCYVSAALPGYSSDGLWALVHLYVGPSPHGAEVWYLLKQRETSWAIAAYKFSHFL